MFSSLYQYKFVTSMRIEGETVENHYIIAQLCFESCYGNRSNMIFSFFWAQIEHLIARKNPKYNQRNPCENQEIMPIGATLSSL